MRLFTTIALSAVALVTGAQSNEWQDPAVNAVNRAPMHTNYFAFESEEAARQGIIPLLIDETCACAAVLHPAPPLPRFFPDGAAV